MACTYKSQFSYCLLPFFEFDNFILMFVRIPSLLLNILNDRFENKINESFQKNITGKYPVTIFISLIY